MRYVYLPTMLLVCTELQAHDTASLNTLPRRPLLAASSMCDRACSRCFPASPSLSSSLSYIVCDRVRAGAFQPLGATAPELHGPSPDARGAAFGPGTRPDGGWLLSRTSTNTCACSLLYSVHAVMHPARTHEALPSGLARGLVVSGCFLEHLGTSVHGL